MCRPRAALISEEVTLDHLTLKAAEKDSGKSDTQLIYNAFGRKVTDNP